MILHSEKNPWDPLRHRSPNRAGFPGVPILPPHTAPFEGP